MAQLHRHRVYRNIELKQQFLGLEMLDALALGGVAWVLMLVNKSGLGWNIFIVLAGYVLLRVVKRGKPDGWTTTVLRFYSRRPYFSAAANDQFGRQHPFPIQPASAAWGRGSLPHR
jgi:hypothetical protein